MSEYDDLPEPILADPDACPEHYRHQRAKCVANLRAGRIGSKVSDRKKAGVRAALSKAAAKPVQLRPFSWQTEA